MRRTYEAAKQALASVYKIAAEDIGGDLREINRKIIAPAVSMGENRLVSAFTAAKLGFAVGGLVGGPPGLVAGTAAGALVGAVGGPTVAEWMGKRLKPDVAPADIISEDIAIPVAANTNKPVVPRPYG